MNSVELIMNNKEQYRCFSCTVAGVSNSNQDYAGSFYDKDNGIGIAVVSDGHGACKHFRSAEGAKFAVKVCMDTLKEALSKDRINSLEDVNYYSKLILTRWRIAVSEHYHANDLTFKENELANRIKDFNIYSLYGTTLNAIAVTSKFWCGIKCGDGEIIRIDKKGRKYNLINPLANYYEMINFTESLCSTKPNLRSMYEEFDDNTNFVAGLVMTDGITNSFDNEAFEDFAVYLIKTQYNNRINAKYNEEQDKELVDYLKHISTNGSCDDTSIAGVFKDNM